jgi:hypothetical protein
MPASTIVIVFGSWLALLALAIWFRWRSAREDEEDAG